MRVCALPPFVVQPAHALPALASPRLPSSHIPLLGPYPGPRTLPPSLAAILPPHPLPLRLPCTMPAPPHALPCPPPLSGADAILLIAAVLPNQDLAYFMKAAGALGMQCLIEVGP